MAKSPAIKNKSAKPILVGENGHRSRSSTMHGEILDGKAFARQIKQDIAAKVATLQARNKTPGLAFVLVGDDPRSEAYVRGKNGACGAVGIYSETFHKPPTSSQDELLALIQDLNKNPQFDGILVQHPLPPHINELQVTFAINAEKDVDGLHPLNQGLLFRGDDPYFVPCTPAGIQEMLFQSGHDPAGKHVVICGRSNIVGKPLAALLMQKRQGGNATVTVCHAATPNLAKYTAEADILVVAMGRPQAITAEMVRQDAVVIDVGNNELRDSTARTGYRMVGDVDFEAVAKKAAAITPVPGGVGPMTVAMLLKNTLIAAQRAVQK